MGARMGVPPWATFWVMPLVTSVARLRLQNSATDDMMPWTSIPEGVSSIDSVAEASTRVRGIC